LTSAALERNLFAAEIVVSVDSHAEKKVQTSDDVKLSMSLAHIT